MLNTRAAPAPGATCHAPRQRPRAGGAQPPARPRRSRPDLGARSHLRADGRGLALCGGDPEPLEPAGDRLSDGHRAGGPPDETLRHRQPPRALLHPSDCGVQYTRAAHRTLRAASGREASMSRKGNPYDNAMMENFMATHKRECVGRAAKAGGYVTRAAAPADSFAYGETYYNRVRLRSALGYQSPGDFETQLNQNLCHPPLRDVPHNRPTPSLSTGKESIEKGWSAVPALPLPLSVNLSLLAASHLTGSAPRVARKGSPVAPRPNGPENTLLLTPPPQGIV